jgi:hypothetical protein
MQMPDKDSFFAGIDTNAGLNANEKKAMLRGKTLDIISQSGQFGNPDQRITVSEVSEMPLLSKYALSLQGITTGDNDYYRMLFWERRIVQDGWVYFQSSCSPSEVYGGRSAILFWGRDGNHIARAQGLQALGKLGVTVAQMSDLPATLFGGTHFDMNAAAIVPFEAKILPAIWAFCASPLYREAVRRVDAKMNVTNATLAKVPFDIEYWASVALTKYPDGLPEPYSDDPTQWLFHGHPAQAKIGTALHIALARLAGYRWPAESDSGMRLSAEAREWIAKAAALPASDTDGVLPLPAVATERSLADRLRDYLNFAIPGWDEARLVHEADVHIEKRAANDLSLETWLRDRAFRQHSALFHNRPFLWQIWDGQKDGFSAILHYHQLDRATLQKLTYTLLGAWIARREAEKDERRVEAARILQKKLEAILEGETPYDIFVRWKSLSQQPIGWDPDLDDGVRLNIRPWVEAGVLREEHPKGIKWGVDRGKDVASAPWFRLDKGERNNDRHISLAEKRAAREAASRKAGAG